MDLKKKIATDPCWCVRAFILHPKNIHTKKGLLQGNVDDKTQLPASPGYFTSRIYSFAFEFVRF